MLLSHPLEPIVVDDRIHARDRLAGAEDVRRDERRRVIPGALQQRRECRHRVGEREAGVVANAVLRRISAGHDRRVSRQGQRRVRRRIEKRRRPNGRARRARASHPDRRRDPDVIGAQRVDGDQDQIGWAVAGGRPSCPALTLEPVAGRERATTARHFNKLETGFSHSQSLFEVYTLAPRRIVHDVEVCVHVARNTGRGVRIREHCPRSGSPDDGARRHGAGHAPAPFCRRHRQRIEPVSRSAACRRASPTRRDSTDSPRSNPASTRWKPRCLVSRPSSGLAITLTLGTTVTIDVTLAVASVSETVEVSGATPVLDVKSSASNTQIAEALLQNLPTGRFQPDVINLAPGVNSNVAFGGDAELERAPDGRRRRQRSGGRHALVVLQLQLGRAGAGRVARRQRRVRRVHRRRRQQHRAIRQQQVHGTGRVPDRAFELDRRQHRVAVARPAEDLQAARDQELLGHHGTDRRAAREGQAVLLHRLPVLQPPGSSRRDSPATTRARKIPDTSAR